MHQLKNLLLTLLPAALVLAPLDGAAQPAPALALEGCRIADANGLRTLPARCGTLTRPQDPDSPDGPQIEIFVALVPALNRSPAPDPLAIFAGGPGAAATEFYVGYAAAFGPIRRDRDILLVDQRGTGRSHPLDCDVNEYEPGTDLSPEAVRDVAARCLEEIDADTRFFTTSLAVRDLEAVRAALGYQSLNLYGGSYGTRVALHYLRRYPDRTRTVILDGVVPADTNVGPEIALDAQAALDAMFSRCEADSECNERFRGIRDGFGPLAAALEAMPRELVMPEPVTGELTEVSFGDAELAVAVRLLSYASSTVSLLPLLLHEAQSADNLAPLSAQAMLATAQLGEALSYGMHNAVVCTEDVPFYDLDAATREGLAATYLGVAQVDGLEAICSVWPRGVIDEAFKTPVVSDKPVLILSGEIDPVTPRRNGERAMATLGNARHLVVSGQAHGVAGIGCIPGLLEDFVDSADVAGLDAGCVDRIGSSPFFVSFSGPAP